MRYVEIIDLSDDDHFVEDTLTGEKLSYEKVIDLLNELNEENEQLKQRVKTQSVDREQLIKRIEELKKENYGNLDGIAFYKEENASLSERISDLECENEQLKQDKQNFYRVESRLRVENKKLKHTIIEAYETERTVLGRSVLKQLAESLEIQL